MTLRFWTRRRHGEYAVEVTDIEYAEAILRLLMSFCWHLEMHKHKDFRPLYAIEGIGEDGEPVVLEEEELEPLPPWER